jgi:hypothetical protein
MHLLTLVAAESALLPSRIQMAFTLAYHVILVPLGVAFPAYTLLMEGIGILLGTPFAAAAVILTPAVGFLLCRRVFRWYRTLSVVVVGSLVFAWGFAQSPTCCRGS